MYRLCGQGARMSAFKRDVLELIALIRQVLIWLPASFEAPRRIHSELRVGSTFSCIRDGGCQDCDV